LNLHEDKTRAVKIALPTVLCSSSHNLTLWILDYHTTERK